MERATMPTSNTTGPRAEEPASPGSDAGTARRLTQERRIAQERRQAHRETAWIDIERALEIPGKDNPADLFAALAAGKIQCQFQHRARRWVSKPVPPRLWKTSAICGNQLIDSDGVNLENEHWKLVINERHWREYLGEPAAVAPSPRTPSKPRDATDDEIRMAMKAVYNEKGDERPDTKKIVSPVRDRLAANGLYAKWETISQISREQEFQKRRYRPGPRRKSLKGSTK
jgi:hypothetical protein